MPTLKATIPAAAAFIGLVIASSSFAQEAPIRTAMPANVASMPSAAREQLAASVTKFQQEALKEVKAIQDTLNTMRTAPAAPTSVPNPARELAIAVKEDELVAARKVLTTAQTANEIVQQKPTSLPPTELSAVLPDVEESIRWLGNPMLPLCGKNLSFRGVAQQVAWQDTLDSFLANHGRVLAAIGRIEVETAQFVPGPNNTLIQKTQRTPIGTGFAIGATHVATAGHVAHLAWDFSNKTLRPTVKAVYFNTGGEHSVGCSEPDRGAQVVRLDSIVSASYAPKTWPKDSPLDYAVLSTALGEAPLQSALKISPQPKLDPAAFVMVVEYPNKDSRVNIALWKTMMNVPIDSNGGMFPVTSIKRIAPGMVVPNCTNASSAHIGHDAGTLNQSSGAPILDVQTGDVVAIQVAGFLESGFGDTSCNLGLRSDQPKFKIAEAAAPTTAPTAPQLAPVAPTEKP
jgi:hypothetical protein